MLLAVVRKGEDNTKRHKTQGTRHRNKLVKTCALSLVPCAFILLLPSAAIHRRGVE